MASSENCRRSIRRCWCSFHQKLRVARYLACPIFMAFTSPNYSQLTNNVPRDPIQFFMSFLIQSQFLYIYINIPCESVCLHHFSHCIPVRANLASIPAGFLNSSHSRPVNYSFFSILYICCILQSLFSIITCNALILWGQFYHGRKFMYIIWLCYQKHSNIFSIN